GYVRALRRRRAALSFPGPVLPRRLRRDPRAEVAPQPEDRGSCRRRGRPGAPRTLHPGGPPFRPPVRRGRQGPLAAGARRRRPGTGKAAGPGVWETGGSCCAAKRCFAEQDGRRKAKGEREEAIMRRAGAALALVLAAASCGPASGGLRPVGTADAENACPGGRRSWNLEISDQRADRGDSDRVREL